MQINKIIVSVLVILILITAGIAVCQVGKSDRYIEIADPDAEPNLYHWEVNTICWSWSMEIPTVCCISKKKETPWCFKGRNPFLADILAFDTAEQAIDYFRRTSNICCEFFSREDASDILLKEYDELCVDYAMLDDGSVESPWTDSGYTKELFLQTYFADSFSKLSESEKDELKSIADEKYIEKLGICEDYSTALLFYEFVQEEYGSGSHSCFRIASCGYCCVR